MAVSVGLWILTSLVAFGLLLWIHFGRPAIRRRAWLALLAGELFLVAGFCVAGAFIEHELRGGLPQSASTLISEIKAGTTASIGPRIIGEKYLARLKLKGQPGQWRCEDRQG